MQIDTTNKPAGELKSPTRADYLAGRATHRKFYGAIVREAGIRFRADDPLVVKSKAALEAGDEHLNKVQGMTLGSWDAIGLSFLGVDRILREHGDYLTLSGACCLAKEAVRQAIESA